MWKRFAPIAKIFAGLAGAGCEGFCGVCEVPGADVEGAPVEAASADLVAMRQRVSQSAVALAWTNAIELVWAATMPASMSASFLRKYGSKYVL